MIATGLRPQSVLLQGSRKHRQLVRQPLDRRLRHRPDVVRYANPSHGNVHSCTANPKRAAEPRPPPRLKLSMNPRSFRVNVKNLTNSSLPMSGYDRSRSICSSEKN